MFPDFDVTYTIRQTGILTAIVLAPLMALGLGVAVASWWTGRLRGRAFAVGLVLAVGSATVWFWLAWQVLASSAEMYADGRFPFPPPLRMGPSPFSLREAIGIFAVTVWLPTCLLFLLRWGFKGRSPLIPTVRLTAALIVTTWMWSSLVVSITEWSHEDTIWAPTFTLIGWRSVSQGMTRDEVHRLLGGSLTEQAGRFSRDSELWVTNCSAGHFAVIKYHDNHVTEKVMWYSD